MRLAMSAFTELRALGTKQIRFKQSKCINNELRNDSNTDRAIKDARDGMCYVFSLAYIQDFLSANKDTDFSVMDATGHTVSGYANAPTRTEKEELKQTGAFQSVTADAKTNNLVRAAVDANILYVTVHERFKRKEINFEKLTHKMANYFGLKLDPWPSSTRKPKNMLQVVDTMAPKAGAQVWMLGLYFKDSAHAVVLARRTGAYHFFDPNLGGYRIERKNIRKFLRHWEDACVSELGADWAIEMIDVTAFVIQPPTGETRWAKSLLLETEISNL
jgi:hypothetical protein